MLVLQSMCLLCRLWNLLLGALMWSSLVEVQDVGFEEEEVVKLFLMKDEEMIQAFSPYAA